jgi:glutamate N-acetyltransferase/amino-acid N-acetyltransferase
LLSLALNQDKILTKTMNTLNILYSAISSGIKQSTIDANNQNPKDGKLDLAIIVLPKGSITAGVFTQNIFCAAPVLIAKNHLQNDVRALIINSGNANAGTGVASGEAGFDNALKICEMLSKELKISENQVMPFSTGVIGQQLPMQSFENFIPKLVKKTSNIEKVAEAIMTTDTFAKIVKKQIIINGKTVNIEGICKGSGMIRPDMATMLGFILTDIKADKNQLQKSLEIAVNGSFNRITVDGDTSTNDSATLSTTGESGMEICDEFQEALNAVAKELSHKIVEDGEGATKFVEIIVEADSSEDCLKVGYTVAHSPLVKTALFAEDANWGRILAAVGRSKVESLTQEKVSIYLGDTCLIKNGEIDKNYTEEAGSLEMKKDKIIIKIIVGKGFTESVWTTDLGYDYVKINAEYRT